MFTDEDYVKIETIKGILSEYIAFEEYDDYDLLEVYNEMEEHFARLELW